MHMFKHYGYCQIPLQHFIAYNAILMNFTKLPGSELPESTLLWSLISYPVFLEHKQIGFNFKSIVQKMKLS